ncbi:chalcone isomerase [Rhizophagus irregularis]|uniref:Chalcone isomerase n=3 Tax=Rhizophagus irregularis TaxID=588596 RepID=A0A2N0RSA3_9GLOM|nr:chalcone-flavanone isomerase-domain-containing protein [Rhizophagus irregularis DAOM 181602=DAOM 197198]EXX75257.1 Aim18p [Rhizophagus irregularis DAOM 197198w]PKC10445.1 chalcone isomerase [Rhizophagus irregularis]EXX75258.1 Aim18p [Rhizophagus irregularis DAOM 197198w]PKC66162.1 chalcone isomerase [Rhizophagus irregularis]POG79595.1 chalcone-flavanone isomerase-domain-containing protein [Rhizophagus irregularis DAOM 181602=DAOM 197198]|eukprot:XP_025186461.1 chalcone-flavanone isomerase-domain-containing protein [Rhizophagus irregularis DAOM 181602=DAOM 197198]
MFLLRTVLRSRNFIRQTSFSTYAKHNLKPSNFRFGFSSGKVKFSTSSTIATAIGLAGVSYWYVYDKNIAFADALPKSVESVTTEEPESGVHIPTYITLHDGTKARLIGLGIRTVSFLKIKVYVIGMYISEDDIDVLKNWKGYDKEKFMSENDESMTLSILDLPIVMAIRIEPVRNTNGHHLRDGFTRAITHRMQDGYMSEEDAENVLKAIKELKAKFPKSVVKAGTALILKKEKNGTLIIEYEGKNMGIVNNIWLTKNIFMSYLAAKNPISEKAKRNIADGFDELLK